MKYRIYGIVVMTAILGSCLSMRPSAAESAMLPAPGEHWLLVGSYLEMQEDSLIRNEHMIFSLQHYLGQSFGQCFYNAQNGTTASRTSGGFTYDSILSGKEGTFPLKVTMYTRTQPVRPGETAPLAGFTLSRNRFDWRCEGGQLSEGIHRNYRLTSSNSLPVQELTTDKRILICTPSLKPLASGTTAWLSFGVFHNPADLLQRAADGNVIWMDLHLKDRPDAFLLIHTDTSGACYVLATGGLDLVPDALVCDAPPWISPVTGLAYALEFSMKEGNGQQLYISPNNQTQEVAIRGNGLWLGSVNITDHTGKVCGFGAMTVLRF